MRELSIVVTCTGRKSLPAAAGLSARDLPSDSLSHRADTWRRRVHRSSAPRRPLRNLYMGDAWVQSIGLERRARAAGFSPTTYVASAGLGLRPVDAYAPAYSATFTGGHPDRVVDATEDAQEWWAELCSDPAATTLAALRGRPALLVLSSAYATPLAEDLRALAAEDDEVLVVGGGPSVPGAHRLVANRALRSALHGSVMSLNQRMAATWLERLAGRHLTAPDAFSEWAAWVDEVQCVESWNRVPMTDDDVMGAIKAMLGAHRNISCSRALRMLRDSDFACEQQRFKRLFTEVTEGRR
jgi:hypothetical protein